MSKPMQRSKEKFTPQWKKDLQQIKEENDPKNVIEIKKSSLQGKKIIASNQIITDAELLKEAIDSDLYFCEQHLQWKIKPNVALKELDIEINLDLEYLYDIVIV